MTYEDRLSQRVSDYFADREKRDSEFAFWSDRGAQIAQAPSNTLTQFWCRKCRKERDGLGEKVVMTWNGEEFAFYRAYRLCHALRRYITDSHLDPYYRESMKLKRQRIEHAKDILQPGDEGFELLYGHKQSK